MTFTPERLAELRALAEKATPGPWTIPSGGNAFLPIPIRAKAGPISVQPATAHSLPDAAFIATAREALPHALDEIERLSEDLHYTRGTCDLAMKHRDIAEAQLVALSAENERLRQEITIFATIPLATVKASEFGTIQWVVVRSHAALQPKGEPT